MRISKTVKVNVKKKKKLEICVRKTDNKICLN